MAGNPKIVAEISAVDHLTGPLAKIMAEAASANKRFGTSQAGLLKEAKLSQAAFSNAQAAHLANIERSNAGLIRTRDILKSIAAIKIGEIAVGGLKEAAHIQDELARARAAGISAPEIKALGAQTANLMGDVIGISQSKMLETARELHSILLKPEKETGELLPSVLRAKQAMELMGGVHGEATSITPVVKALESLGLTQDKGRFSTALEFFTKAQTVFGANFLRPDTYREAVLNTGSSGQFLSDGFRNKYLPTLIQEMGGRAGTGIQMMEKEIGGTLSGEHGALKEMMRLGLVDRASVDFLKSGEAKSLKAGKSIQGADVAALNPLEWVNSYLKPALEKAGITKDADVASEIRKLFGNKSAASIVAKMIEQDRQLQKDASNIQGAPGFKNLEQVGPALEAIKTAAQGVIATTTAPIMPDIASGLNTASEAIGHFNGVLKGVMDAHPTAAKVAGAGAILTGGALGLGAVQAIFNKLTGAGAIKASALELHASAVALDRAAAALQTSAKAGAVGKGAAAAEGATGATAAEALSLTRAFMLSTLAPSIITGTAAAVLAAQADKSTPGWSKPLGGPLVQFDNGGIGPILPPEPDAAPMPGRPHSLGKMPPRPVMGPPTLAELHRLMLETPLPHHVAPTPPPPPIDYETLARAACADRKTLYNSNPERELEATRGRAFSNMDGHGNGDIIAAIQGINSKPVSVSGTVEGSANVKVEATVNASPLLVAELKSIKDGMMSLKGSVASGTGATMHGSNAPASATHGGGVGHM